MKNSILILMLSFLFGSLTAQNFQLSPSQPQSGEVLNFSYEAEGGELAAENVIAVAYVFEMGERLKAIELDLSNIDNTYHGSYSIPEAAQAIFFKFQNEDGSKVDKNDNEGYHTKIYKDGIPVKNAHLMVSSAYAYSARWLGLESNPEKVKEAFELEMSVKDERFSKDYLPYYATAVKLSDDQEGKESIISFIKSEVSKEGIDEKRLSSLSSTARSLKDKALYNSIQDQIKEKYPSGIVATKAKYTNFRRLKTLDEKLDMYNDAISNHSDKEEMEYTLDNMELGLANAYGAEGDFDKMLEYIAKVTSATSIAGVYNNIAWGCSGESIEGEGHDIKRGMELSKKSLDLIKGEMETLSSKVSFYTDKEWKKRLEGSYGMYSDTYALLAYKNGDVKTALEYQKIACESYDFSDAELNSRYALFTEKAQGPEEAMVLLEDMISQGAADSGMKEQFSRLFKTNVSLDQAADRYLSRLESEARAKHIEEIKEAMFEKETAGFELKNLAGESVTLESLQGKIIVVDFWATWCGPCIRSFPGMQKAVDKYADSEDVAFIFIDTWESVKNKEENAKKFIDENGYSFNVLMDTKDKVVSDFGVKGIPAKFIMDQNGKIRFESTGFNGNDDDLIDEISIVVDILRGEGKSANNPAGARP